MKRGQLVAITGKSGMRSKELERTYVGVIKVASAAFRVVNSRQISSRNNSLPSRLFLSRVGDVQRLGLVNFESIPSHEIQRV